MPLNRSPAEILGAWADNLKADIRKCVPATVTAVDTSKQTVDVQVAVNDLLFDDLGNAVSMPAPSISGVPLACLRGGGMVVWLPVAVGDSVLLIFADQSADTWRVGVAPPCDPGFAGKHTADSAFAIPAFAPDTTPLASPAAGKLVIGQDAAPGFQMVIDAGSIDVGGAVGGTPGTVVPTAPGAAARVGDIVGPWSITKGSTRVLIGG